MDVSTLSTMRTLYHGRISFASRTTFDKRSPFGDTRTTFRVGSAFGLDGPSELEEDEMEEQTP
jgi:hypothetical protein